MAKPWARIEQNYINHRKFLALDAGAICLWHEGKNYCDMFQTDGLIPREALKTFRFTSRKAIEALTTSAGDKPNGEAYSPLWETAGTIGFKMHDYLDHNDCRDAVLNRIAQADTNRAADAERKRLAREAKKSKRPPDVQPDIEPDSPVVVREMSGSIQKQIQKQLQEEKEQKSVTHTRGDGVLAGMLPKDHLRHAACGRVCLQQSQFQQLVRKLGGPIEAAEIVILTWARGILATWDMPPLMNHPIQGTTFQWWDARWEEWQGKPQAAPASKTLQPRQDWSCRHEPPCAPGTSAFRCNQRTQLEAARVHA